MKRSIVAFGVVTLFVGAAVASPVKEKSTGVEFASEIEAQGSQEALSGVGVRTKSMFNVKVYAAGIYLDKAQAKEKLAKWKGKQPNAALFAALSDPNLDKTLRMVFARDVDAEDLGEAFDESLGPRVKEAEKKGNKGGVAALSKFKSYFKEGSLKEKNEILFTCKAGTMFTTIKGKAMPPIPSKPLCWALFDTYFGKDPIGEDLKKGLVARLPDVLKD